MLQCIRASSKYATIHSAAAVVGASNRTVGTIAGWFRGGTTDASSMLWSAGNSLTGGGWRAAYLASGNVSGAWGDESLLFGCHYDSSAGSLEMVWRNGHDFLRDGALHHVAAVVDGVANRLIVDGVARTTTFGVGGATTAKFLPSLTAGGGTPAGYIGALSDEASVAGICTGELADVRLYGRGLSDAEAKELYIQRGGDRIRRGLLAHWPLIGSPAETAGGRNATLVNTPSFTAAPFRRPKWRTS